MTSPTPPGVTHRFERLAEYVDEVRHARIWGGIHYRNSTEVAERMGRAIGRLVVDSALQPRWREAAFARGTARVARLRRYHRALATITARSAR